MGGVERAFGYTTNAGGDGEALSLQLEPDPRPASLPRLWSLTPTGRTAAGMGAGGGHVW